MVWPETMYSRSAWITADTDAVRPEEVRDGSDQQFREALARAVVESRRDMLAVAGELGTTMILGIDREHFGRDGVRLYNSSVCITPRGQLLGSYDKMHLVMFGEYVPLAEYFPFLQRLTPLPVSATSGDRPAGFTLGKLCIVPDICYESVLSHVIRRQVNALRAEGLEPAILVNLTNDGWCWGSNELEMHFACGVFRAVECRKPMLIAANTGISAWIDGDGRVQARGPRRATDVIRAEVRLDRRASFYLDHGDWPAGICLALTAVFGLVGLWDRRRGARA